MDEAISLVEDCQELPRLSSVLQRIVEDYGFGACCFLDIREPPIDVRQGRELEYQHNGFIQVGGVIHLARRTNRPFR